MIEVKEHAHFGEPMAMYVVANNDPGHGEWYIECVAYRGYNDAGTNLGMVAYSYCLQQFRRAIEMREIRDNVNDPRDLLALVPAKWHPTMRDQIDEFLKDELPALLGGTLKWHEEYEAEEFDEEDEEVE